MTKLRFTNGSSKKRCMSKIITGKRRCCNNKKYGNYCYVHRNKHHIIRFIRISVNGTEIIRRVIQ